MFSFGADEYRWCCKCAGNIRKDAYYCRFCHVPVGSKLLKDEEPVYVSSLITATARWLSRFDDVFGHLPQPFQERIIAADKKTPGSTVGLKPGVDQETHRRRERNCDKCPPNQPSPMVLGLVTDALISVHANGFSLLSTCSDPRLQLLEINPGEVAAEFELRQEEFAGANRCAYCAEYIMSVDLRCRFCDGQEGAPPRELNSVLMQFEVERYDESLLRAIISWECAKRRLEGEPPVEQKHLQKYKITENQIDQQVLMLRKEPNYLPHSRWRQRMLHLGITPGYFEETWAIKSSQAYDLDYFMLQDIQQLGSALTPSFRANACADHDEAMVVFDHLFARWQSNPHFEKQKFSFLNSQAMVYLAAGNDDRYNELTKEAEAEMMKGLPPGSPLSSLRDISKNSSLLKFSAELQDSDPEKRLEAFEKMDVESAKQLSSLREAMSGLLPGLAEAFGPIEQSTNKSKLLTILTLKAQCAEKKGDHRAAAEFYETALTQLAAGPSVVVHQKSHILASLAQVQFRLGEVTLADETFKNAIADAEDNFEANLESWPLVEVHHKYACHLEETNRYEESKNHFEQAISFKNHSEQRLVDKGYLKEEDRGEGLAKLKEDYARLLHLVEQHDEAAAIEEEVCSLKEKDKQRKQRRAAAAEKRKLS